MRTRTILSVLTVLGLVAGCGAEVGEAGSTLRRVDVQAMTGETLYMLPELSALPFTVRDLAEQGVDPAETIPVRVEIFESTAVAWYAPEGVAVVDRDSIIALWRVERTEIADPSVRPDGDYTVSEPSYVVTDLLSDLDYQPDFPGGGDITTQVTTSQAEQAILDFADRLGSPDELPMIGELATHHPGCL